MTVRKLYAVVVSCILALALSLPFTALAAGESVSLDDHERTITIPEDVASETITLKASFSNFTNDKLCWTVDNDLIADFGGASTTVTTGLAGKHEVVITGKTPGRTTVRVAADDDPGVELAHCTIIVKKRVKVSLVTSSPSALQVGDGVYGTAEVSVVPNDYATYCEIAWSSSDTDIVKVSGSGKTASYTAGTKVGTATISATVKSSGSMKDYIVGSAASFSVDVTSTRPYMKLRKTPNITFTEYDFPGTVSLEIENGSGLFDASCNVEWSSSDGNVLKFDSSSPLYFDGTTFKADRPFTTKKNGTTTITAKVRSVDGSILLSDSVKVKVDKKIPFLTLEGESHMSASQRNLTLKLKLDNNGTDIYDGDEHITFKSSDPKRVAIYSRDSRLDDFQARVVVRGLYNVDKVRITAYMNNNKDISTYHTVYVTGLKFLPQTGQDTMLLYVSGAASLLMFITAAYFAMRREKNAKL